MHMEDVSVFLGRLERLTLFESLPALGYFSSTETGIVAEKVGVEWGGL